MAGRRLSSRVPATWRSVVLDSEGLWAVARNDNEDARATLVASVEAGIPVLVPTTVLAETLTGDRRDARANQALKRLRIVPLDEEVARLAARLKAHASMTGVAATVDATVVATSAVAGGGVILTSDVGDISALADGISGQRIRAVRV